MKTNANNNNSNNNNINEFKTEIKKEIDKIILFPYILPIINNLDLYELPKPLLDISLFKPSQSGLNLNNPNTNNIVALISEEIFTKKFNPTTEFISKPYSIYSTRRINKIFFLSNLYKIFMTNIPTTIPFSTFDFFSTIILLCPDFPKLMIKKMDLLYQNFSNSSTTPEIFNQNIELKTRVNMNEIFVMFCVYFLYNNFFNEIDKFYLNINSSMATVKGLKSIKGLQKEFYYTSIILANKKLKEEYNLNTMNTLDDVEEILDKNSEIKISYTSLCEKILKNKSLIECIFSVDEKIRLFQDINNKY
jgi:hypothetical protein